MDEHPTVFTAYAWNGCQIREPRHQDDDQQNKALCFRPREASAACASAPGISNFKVKKKKNTEGKLGSLPKADGTKKIEGLTRKSQINTLFVVCL